MLTRRGILAASSALVLLMGVILMPTDLPYTISTTGLVMPVSEWTISRVQNGNLVSTLKDNRTGRLSHYSTSVFQRGNQSNFQLNTVIYHQSHLNKGDTVATMYSNQDEEELTQLQGELAVQKAQLRLYSSGQKMADIEGVMSRVELAKQEVEAQRPMTIRTAALYKDSLISRQEYETAINKLRVQELSLKMAEADYTSAITGEKPEQIQVVATQIESLQNRIQQIQNSLKDLTLTSPVSGAILLKKATTPSIAEILLSVADNSAYVVVMPIDYLEKDYVQLDQPVKVAITGTTQLTFGRIINIDNTVQIVDGHQAFFITTLIEQKDLPLLPGMFVKSTIQCPPITLKEHVTRLAKLFFIY